jgi:hypothetical protein
VGGWWPLAVGSLLLGCVDPLAPVSSSASGPVMKMTLLLIAVIVIVTVRETVAVTVAVELVWLLSRLRWRRQSLGLAWRTRGAYNP